MIYISFYQSINHWILCFLFVCFVWFFDQQSPSSLPPSLATFLTYLAYLTLLYESLYLRSEHEHTHFFFFLLIKLYIVSREQSRATLVMAEPPVLVREFLDIQVSRGRRGGNETGEGGRGAYESGDRGAFGEAQLVVFRRFVVVERTGRGA